MMKELDYKKLEEKYPFLTVALYADAEYIGIIQNSSKAVTSMYCMNLINDNSLKTEFLKQAEIWWWTSNRTISINIFLKPAFDKFKPFLKHFSSKEFTLLHGPLISMENLTIRRPKRRQITLIRNLDLDKISSDKTISEKFRIDENTDKNLIKPKK